MIGKILLGIGGLLLVFLGYVSTRPGNFHYERSLVIQASPEKIFPYLHDFKLGAQWNPYDQKDPQMKRIYSGPAVGPGSLMAFEGNNDVGSGKLEIVREVPNQLVEIRLSMLKPFQGISSIVYSLNVENTGTRMTWSMSGENGFLSKLVSVFIDCEKMVAGDFEVGLKNLERVVATNSK